MLKKLNKAEERQLAESVQRQRGKLNLSKKPLRARKGSGDAVFSVRFSADEFELIRERASHLGTTISAVIRDSVFRANETPHVSWLTQPHITMFFGERENYSRPLTQVSVAGADDSLKEQWEKKVTTG